MSGIEEAIVDRLLTTPAVTAIVVTRIFPGSVPQGEALPAVVFNKISGAPLYADEGEVGLDQARLQIDCWGATYTDAKQLGRAVRGALSAWFSDLSLYLELDIERDLREGGANTSEYRFRTSMDFLALYRSN